MVGAEVRATQIPREVFVEGFVRVASGREGDTSYERRVHEAVCAWYDAHDFVGNPTSWPCCWGARPQRRSRSCGACICKDPRVDETTKRLVDEAAVRRAILTVARAIDRLDFELLASCYHPDASDQRHGRVREIAEFLEWVKPILRGMESTMHRLSTQFIDIEGDVARAETYCVARHLSKVEGQDDPQEWFAYLRYLDTLERREDGVWRIARRVCAYEPGTLNPNTMERVPAESLGGARDRSDPSYR